MPRKKKILSNIEEIVSDYKNGASMRGLCRKYHIVFGVLRREFDRCNIEAMPRKYDYNLKYSCDSDFFSVIDSHEKAYWLGFIYAGGGLSNVKYYLRITLASVDYEHLAKFKNSLKSNNLIRKFTQKTNYYRGGNCEFCSFVIYQQKMVDDLIKLGCLPHKSTTTTFPTEDHLLEKFYSSFILGYIDGDGGLTINNGRWGVNIIGTYQFLDKIGDVFSEINIKKPCLVQEKRSGKGLMYYASFGGAIYKPGPYKFGTPRKHNIIKLYNYLYSYSPVWLTRKRDKFEEILRLCYGEDWKNAIKQVELDNPELFKSKLISTNQL